ncbi:PREDICTED: uncharacterized protein LOC108777498 [Cyphomyrmex costatus]|uniref:Ima1 N-terminal domain-containing protein n=1 Tax=Cyphomyrmex costatus TaxID=456900 RepID=A0A195CC61_9HYME|nr:PREDICTED: uncharacterized protein LOC108777498 [Cyphomyrmex costatus]KYM98449.1 hypothetical protein ALC62_10805 [Cyphomyrmex costatus]
METDHNAAFDSVAVFAPILLILATFLTMFYRLRARWPVKVNCWFCNENTKIWRQHLDWWLCPWCQQYNGFSKNGDYMYNIPEQYVTPKGHTRYCRLSEDSDSHHVLKDSLCACCNKRESLKLSELANFEPKDENLFNTELKAFKEYLEARYPLCDSCKSTVRNVLYRQAVWLTRYKMLFFRQKPLKMFISKAKKSETVFRVISTILISIVMYNHDFIWLPISGLFFHLCACWSSLMRKRSFDILLIFLWFCVITLMSIKDLTIVQNPWVTAEYIVQYRMVSVCAFITALVSLRSSLYKSTSTGSVVFKKIKLHSRDVPSQLECNSQNRNNTVPSEMNDSIKSSVYAASEVSPTEIKFSKSHSAILRRKLSTITNNGTNGSLNSVSQNDSPPDSCLNDSLNSLLLNEDPPKYDRITKMAPAIFERRVYSATSSENLFRKSGSKHRCILSPPKLRSVTQTSWVAGGYWQESMIPTLPTLSRSSSQSSGFGSVGSSNLAPSREPSVHELDRCSSAASEIWRWSCQTPRPGPYVARHDSPVPRPQSRYSDVTGSHLRAVPSPAIRAMLNTDNHVQESCVHGPDIGDVQNSSVPAYAGHHTTTIVASPGWLSALLCVSLILNMIVLCTTLLR